MTDEERLDYGLSLPLWEWEEIHRLADECDNEEIKDQLYKRAAEGCQLEYIENYD